jgi:hypothetical protein
VLELYDAIELVDAMDAVEAGDDSNFESPDEL